MQQKSISTCNSKTNDCHENRTLPVLVVLRNLTHYIYIWTLPQPTYSPDLFPIGHQVFGSKRFGSNEEITDKTTGYKAVNNIKRESLTLHLTKHAFLVIIKSIHSHRRDNSRNASRIFTARPLEVLKLDWNSQFLNCNEVINSGFNRYKSAASDSTSLLIPLGQKYTAGEVEATTPSWIIGLCSWPSRNPVPRQGSDLFFASGGLSCHTLTKSAHN